MPGPQDAAEIVLLDTSDGYAERVVDTTRAWNVQQGTMLYWNPANPENQFFFNDRDPRTGKVFCALYDIEAGRRVRKYRFDDTPIGNGGVSSDGRYFAGINYARMVRLRPVTGYPGATDWTEGVSDPSDDGVFRVEVETGQKELLVSFQDLAEALRREHPDIDSILLFINHTLWNRNGERLFFFARGNFGGADLVNASFTVGSDGANLARQSLHIGGHPEWDAGARMIGAMANRQAVYDTEAQDWFSCSATATSSRTRRATLLFRPTGNGSPMATRTTAKCTRFCTIARPDKPIELGDTTSMRASPAIFAVIRLRAGIALATPS